MSVKSASRKKKFKTASMRVGNGCWLLTFHQRKKAWTDLMLHARYDGFTASCFRLSHLNNNSVILRLSTKKKTSIEKTRYGPPRICATGMKPILLSAVKLHKTQRISDLFITL